jgi:hypothetical protein
LTTQDKQNTQAGSSDGKAPARVRMIHNGAVAYLADTDPDETSECL